MELYKFVQYQIIFNGSFKMFSRPKFCSTFFSNIVQHILFKNRSKIRLNLVFVQQSFQKTVQYQIIFNGSFQICSRPKYIQRDFKNCYDQITFNRLPKFVQHVLKNHAKICLNLVSVQQSFTKSFNTKLCLTGLSKKIQDQIYVQYVFSKIV